MRKTLYIVVITLISFHGHCQKKLDKQFSSNGIFSIEIDGDGMFEIEVTTSKTNVISMQATIAGETFENVLIETKQENNTLNISQGYAPFFNPIDDKLAAHKVLAIDLKLTIPKHLKIAVSSNSASFKGSGNFKNIVIVLENGNCQLRNFKGSGLLQTKQGNIDVSVDRQVSVRTSSTYGNIQNPTKTGRRFRLTAESVFGDVVISQE